MVNRDGQFKTSLPTSYRSSFKKGKSKFISIDGDDLRRCPNCQKRKMLVKHKYQTEDGKYYKYSRCANCDYQNYIPLKDDCTSVTKHNLIDLICPNCKSTKKILSSPYPDGSIRFECSDCGHVWGKND